MGKWRISIFGDGWGYIEISKLSFHEMLGSARTLGFPVFLKWVATFSPDYSAIPWIHLAFLAATVFFFDYAMRRYGASPWEAFAASTGVLLASANWLIGALLTDFLGQMFAVATIACLLCLVVDVKRIAPWCGVAFGLAATYHMRPAYLFLIPLVPCLGVLLLRIRIRWTKEGFHWKKMFLGLAAVGVLPYLGYCEFRNATVGHFGLVSFGGQQVAAFAVEFLDRDMIEKELPKEYRLVATRMLDRRQQLNRPPTFKSAWRIDMKQWERNYDANIQNVAIPIAIQTYGDDRVVWNRKLTAFSHVVIQRRLGKYVQIYVYSLPRAIAKLFGRSWALMMLVPVTVALFVFRRWLFRHRRLTTAWRDDPRSLGVLAAFFWLATVYLFAKIGFVLTVLFVDSRYALPAGIFVPSLFMLIILRELRQIHFAWNGQDGSRLAAADETGKCPRT